MHSMLKFYLQSLVLTLLLFVPFGFPRMDVVDGADSRLQHLFQTSKARSCCRVEGSTLYADAESCRRQNCILFGMHANAKVVCGPRLLCAVAIGAAMTAAVRTIPHFCRSAIVSRRDNPVFNYDDRFNFLPFAIGSRPNCESNVHKVGVTVRLVMEFSRPVG